MSRENKEKVIELFVSQQRNKGLDIDLNNKHVRFIKCCDDWQLNQTLSINDFNHLVTVSCIESRELIIDERRLLKDVAEEANKQLKTTWKSGRDKDFIEKLLSKLEEDENFFELDPLILRPKVTGEPLDGSYYILDGNHRALVSAIFFLRKGKMPKLNFNISKTIDEQKFFEEKGK